MVQGDPRVPTARRAARRGGAVAQSYFRRGVDVETKADRTDFLTVADREAQDAVIDAVEASYPDEPVVGEEAGAPSTVPETGPAWVVDPIDGTNNFVRGIRRWTTSVAAVVDGEAVGAASVLPALGDSYVAGPDGVTRNGEPVTVSDRRDPETFSVTPTIWWPRDRRDEYATAAREIVDRFGDLVRLKSVQATLALVAAGALDGAITNVETNPWDTIAGAYMVDRAGGTVTDLDGDPWHHTSRGLVASNGRAHAELLAAAREIAP